MDSFEWNKIVGAVLGTLMFVVILKIATEAIFEVSPPAKPGYVVEGVPAAATSGTAAQPTEEPLPDFGTVLPTANISQGQQISHQCEQCHDLSKGGPNKIGPNLWGVVGRPRATHPDFNYSSAMSAKHDPWTFEDLFRYLKSPQSIVPGTKMSFAGLRSAQDRINLIAYLRMQSDSPVPIPPPAPKTAAPSAAAKPAARGKPAAETGPAPSNDKPAPANPTPPQPHKSQ